MSEISAWGPTNTLDITDAAREMGLGGDEADRPATFTGSFWSWHDLLNVESGLAMLAMAPGRTKEEVLALFGLWSDFHTSGWLDQNLSITSFAHSDTLAEKMKPGRVGPNVLWPAGNRTLLIRLDGATGALVLHGETVATQSVVKEPVGPRSSEVASLFAVARELAGADDRPWPVDTATKLATELGLPYADACDPIHLIGVRHHSPTLARVMPQLLAAAAPDAIVIELPPEAQEWLEWIAHPEAAAPLAFAVSVPGGGLSFYPFADFSPELVALRWARQAGVPVLCGDLSVTARATGEEPPETADGQDRLDLLVRLAAVARADRGDETWDRLVEVPGTGAAPEAVRRSGLAFGWVHRFGESIDAHTNAREATMRQTIRHAIEQHGARICAVTGAFHSPALTQARVANEADADRELLAQWTSGEGVPALVAYGTAQLDTRSGYPSGIRDPQWQQQVLLHGGDATRLAAASIDLLTRMAAGIRAERHPAGPAEVREAARVALDLASLRGLPAPGRRELLEGCTTVFAQGDVLGRGRVVARVAQRVLVGADVGRLATGTPRSGLGVDFEEQLRRLKLPSEHTSEPKELRLEPTRTDREREIFLWRCVTSRIAYAEPVETVGVGGADAVTSRWRIRMTAATEASLAVAGRWGVTVAQAAAGALREGLATIDVDPPEDETVLSKVTLAAACGLREVFTQWLDVLAGLVAPRAGLAVLVSAITQLERVRSGAVAGAMVGFEEARARVDDVVVLLTEVAVAQVEGLAGSDQLEDVAALAALAGLSGLGVRLRHTLSEMTRTGSPLMQGAAEALLYRLEINEDSPTDALPRIAERIAGAHSPTARKELRRWLAGLLGAAPDLPGSDAALTDALRAGVEGLPDSAFVHRLPALRGGFDGLSPAARERLFDAFEVGSAGAMDVSPEVLAAWAAEDQQVRERLDSWGLADVSYAPAQRWSLVLGRRRQGLDANGRRLARSLDELYGTGTGEGEADDRLAGPGGGKEPPQPSARVWGEELEGLFGGDVRDDITAEAAAAGHPGAVELLATADKVNPSVELLSSVLSMAGGLPESVVARLRPVLRRVVDQLSRALANRLQPALRGMAGTRRTLRRSPRIDAAATIRRNLRHTVLDEEGERQLVVAAPVFRQPMARSEWHIIVLVDVSGSMETSTVFAALTSAVFAGVPALSVTFLAFSTEVVDLTDHVTDPLALLLEISIGGGTNIARAVRAARERVRVPTRTMVVVISDFEEGGSVPDLLAGISALHTAGVKLLGCAALDDTGAARWQPRNRLRPRESLRPNPTPNPRPNPRATGTRLPRDPFLATLRWMRWPWPRASSIWFSPRV